MNTLFKGGYDGAGYPNPNRVGDGSAMDAVRNENFTGRQPGNASHTIKVKEQLNRLTKWLDVNPTRNDDWLEAKKLEKELEELLGTA